MRKIILFVVFLLVNFQQAMATGEPATQFNIFVPPNNDNVRRDVCLIVTALYDSTFFSILDDGMDGDTDDTKSGMLMAGQSYILYIRDNGVNDDAPAASNGIKKQDGDYFNITANKLILASQSTDSDWQHDWVPSISGTGIGTKFLIYAPKISSSQRDVNVMAYDDSTTVTIRKISSQPTTTTGYTQVDMYTSEIVAQKMIHRGEDLIYFYNSGRDLLISGHSYVLETNKPVTVQYGALWKNERDGGGYVPSANGSCSGNSFYFTVPYQVTTEQEIRLVSWDDGNNIVLERYLAGSWVNVKNFTGLNAKKTGEWIGKANGQTYPTVFRARCTEGKRMSVFEANWLETGSVGTSDIATMASSSNGKASGKEFLVYMAPPGFEQNVLDPFTGLKLTQNTHAYIFANINERAIVTVKDAYTNGLKLNRVYTIEPGRYIDCNLNLAEWKSIYNGTGTASGPERPYLLIESSEEVSVMVANFNDNWMMYFGSSQVKALKQTGSLLDGQVAPGNTITLVSTITTESTVNNAQIEVVVASGLIPVKSTLTNLTSNESTNGEITAGTDYSVISFSPVSQLQPSVTYQVETEVKPSLLYNNGTPVADNTVLSIETVVTANVNGQLEQSVLAQSVSTQTSNTSNFLFSKGSFGNLTSDLTTSWTSNWVDVDGDHDDDLFVCELDKAKQNILYLNTNGSFARSATGIFTSSTDRGASISSSWADTDNDGDLDFIVANNGKPGNFLYKNNGSGSFSKIMNDPTVNTIGYYHGVSFADYDNDGFVDLFMSDYMPTMFNRLFHNDGDGTFTEIFDSPITAEAAYSLIGTWSDFDNDGDLDLFVANDKYSKNSFYRNEGHGKFIKLSNSILCNETGSSVSASWVDYDNDLDMDLYVVNSSSDAFLYNNAGDGSFTKVLNSPIVKLGNGSTHGCSWMDFDNDGDLDLYAVTNNKSKLLFLNDGQGSFVKETTEIVNSSLGSTYSSACSDFDKDGDVDIFAPSLDKGVNYLFTHNPTANHYLEIRLNGRVSNGSAIGAKIFVKANIKGADVWQMREVNAQAGFGGQGSFVQHFGLASASSVDSLIIKWPSGIQQIIDNVGIDQILDVVEPTGCRLTALLFEDSDLDCIQSTGEKPLMNRKIKVSPGNIYAVSNQEGIINLDLAPGAYSVQLVNDGQWRSFCTVENFVITPSMINTSFDLGQFGYTSIGESQDAFVSLNCSAQRRGFKNKIKLQVGNAGNQTVLNDTVKFTLPQGVYLHQASPSWWTQDGNTYSWLLPELLPGQTLTIDLLDSVGLNMSLGDEIFFTAQVSGPLLDADRLNNSQQLSMLVVGSLDPNDIAVYPIGEGKEGYVSKNQTLTYTVRFENIGNYEAENITIKDTLPEGLDWSTIEILNSSHPLTLTNYDGLLIIRMEEANLPGRVQDSVLCHGFVQFKVNMLENVSSGLVLENTASIFFDYNEAVVTNTVRNTIKFLPAENEVLTAPNPAYDYTILSLWKDAGKYESELAIESIQLMSVWGDQVIALKGIKESTYRLPLEGIAPGTYILKVVDTGNRIYTSKLIRK